MTFLFEPLEYMFFRHGLIAALMVGALCGLMGVYVVLRGMSYVGHGLSHAAFGGAVVGFVFNFNFYAGAGAMSLVAALLIDRITQNGKIKLDAAIGIVTTAIFALGVAIISQVRTFNKSLDAALFGNILGITDGDLMIIGIVTLSTLLMMFLLYRPLLFSTFDKEAAQIFGIKTAVVQLLFTLLLTLSIIASMNIVGVTMIAATLIMPAMTARMMTDRFSYMQIYSIVIGAITGGGGMYLSYYLNAASGATIVLFGAFLFCFSTIIKHIRDKRILRANLHRHGDLVHSHPHDNEHGVKEAPDKSDEICLAKKEQDAK